MPGTPRGVFTSPQAGGAFGSGFWHRRRSEKSKGAELRRPRHWGGPQGRAEVPLTPPPIKSPRVEEAELVKYSRPHQAHALANVAGWLNERTMSMVEREREGRHERWQS